MDPVAGLLVPFSPPQAQTPPSPARPGWQVGTLSLPAPKQHGGPRLAAKGQSQAYSMAPTAPHRPQALFHPSWPFASTARAGLTVVPDYTRELSDIEALGSP